jgi:hypothetical protein
MFSFPSLLLNGISMKTLRSALVCAGILACLGSSALAAEKCHYVSSWQVSRHENEANLVTGTADAGDYVVVVRKGGVTVIVNTAGGQAGASETPKRLKLAAPNSLVLRQVKDVRVEQMGRIPSHGILQVCKW